MPDSQEKKTRNYRYRMRLDSCQNGRSKRAAPKGFADIFLEPFLAKYPDLPYTYLIELKYLKRGAHSDSLLQQTMEEAQGQLALYLQKDLTPILSV